MTILLIDKNVNYVKKGIRTNCKTLREAFTGTNHLALREPEYHFSKLDPAGRKALSYLKGIKTKYSKLHCNSLYCLISYSDDPADWGGILGL